MTTIDTITIYFLASFFMSAAVIYWQIRKRKEELNTFKKIWPLVLKAIDEEDSILVSKYVNQLARNPNMVREHYKTVLDYIHELANPLPDRLITLIKTLDELYEKKGWNALDN
ncbi:MAG: hypothetical protein ACPGLV_03720 [Bacteroidia bacterium]